MGERKREERCLGAARKDGQTACGSVSESIQSRVRGRVIQLEVASELQ